MSEEETKPPVQVFYVSSGSGSGSADSRKNEEFGAWSRPKEGGGGAVCRSMTGLLGKLSHAILHRGHEATVQVS